MTNTILVVVDMQKDFVDGSLGTKEAQAIVPKVVRKILEYPGQVVFTMDTHPKNYLLTQEGIHLPVKHCIKGTPGWELVGGVKELQRDRHYKMYEKPTFGSLQLAEDLRKRNAEAPITEIEIIGLCTDICVVSNALLIKAALPEVPVCVDSSCCAGVTPAKHESALETMRSCQVEVK